MQSFKRYVIAMPSQQGFTLIELMISLVLGLLISAAVVQIYLANVRTSTVQKSGSELQDASVFGLQMLESHIRLANLGNPVQQINDTTIKGGIVLTPVNIGMTAATFPNLDYLSRSAGDTPKSNSNGWTGVSNVNDDTGKTLPSDQLTLQFINTTGVVMVDCEGNDIDPNTMVIERYFIRPSVTNPGTGIIKNLVLACDAGRIALNSSGVPTGVQNYPVTDQRAFGQSGQEFILNIDQFKVLLGVESVTAGTAGNMQYISSNAYNAITTDKPPIVSVKVGIIIHGGTPIIGNDDTTDFTLLGQINKLKTDSTRKKQVRTTYESTSLLRNARIMLRPTTTTP